MSKSENLKIRISDQSSVNWALKKFKRMCEAYGVVREYRKRKSYLKPSEALKEKLKAAEKRRQKTNKKDSRPRRTT